MLQKLKTSMTQMQKELVQPQTPQPAAQQPEVVTFSLARMDEFSHEELQQVIVRYDGQLKKYKALMQEKDTKIQSLEAKVEQVVTEQQSIEEMMTLRSDEINSLKQHMQTFMNENESLKRLVAALEQSTLHVEDLETENQQLKLQLDDVKSLNASLSQGDAETIYRTKYELLISEHEKMKNDDFNLRQSLQRSNDQLSQLAQESEEMELSIQEAEAVIQKKDKLIEQLKQRQRQFLDEKQESDDKIAALTQQIQRSEMMTKQIGRSNDTVITEHAERIRGKDLVIQDLNSQLRQVNSKISSMNEKEIYYKRQIETLQRTVYDLKQDLQASVMVKQLNEHSPVVIASQDQPLGVAKLMSQLLEIQGSPQTQTSTSGETSILEQEQQKQQENQASGEVQELRQELSEIHLEHQKLVLVIEQLSESKSQSDALIEEMRQKLQKQAELVQELERRRLMARNEVKQLLLKTPKVSDQVQQASLLQLRVLKKDLQLLYKDFLTSDNRGELEKTINDMIFNVNDCIQEAELNS